MKDTMANDQYLLDSCILSSHHIMHDHKPGTIVSVGTMYQNIFLHTGLLCVNAVLEIYNLHNSNHQSKKLNRVDSLEEHLNTDLQ